RFLRAGDDQILIGSGRGLERADVLAAQLVMHRQRLAGLESRRERLRVERDGAVAAADLKRLAFQAHRSWPARVQALRLRALRARALRGRTLRARAPARRLPASRAPPSLHR